MTTAVVRFADHADAEVVVPGRLLPLQLPDGLRAHRIRNAERVEVTLVSDRATAKFAGRLDVPFVRSDGTVDVRPLFVPPPAPWRWGDVRTMQRAVDRLELEQFAGRSGLEEREDARRRSAERVAWLALNHCSASARRTLVRWPHRSDSRLTRVALEQARGTELIAATEVQLGVTIDLLRGRGRIVPERTVRRVRSSIPWTSTTLAAVATRVKRALEDAERLGVIGEVPTAIVNPIRSVALLARPSVPIADPPLSSWPPSFVTMYLSCLEVLSALSQGGRHSGWVPLTDLWRLYELWLAERTLAITTRLLGTPSPIGPGASERIAAHWSGPGWDLELRHPCVLTAERREMLGYQWWSVSSRLDPDIMLISRTASGARCIVLDAKDRPRLTQGDLAAEASKYLWGIRRDDSSQFGVNAVVLVSPYGGDAPFDQEVAMQWSLHGHPHAPRGQAPGAIGMDLDSRAIRDLLANQLALPPDAFQPRSSASVGP